MCVIENKESEAGEDEARLIWAFKAAMLFSHFVALQEYIMAIFFKAELENTGGPHFNGYLGSAQDSRLPKVAEIFPIPKSQSLSRNYTNKSVISQRKVLTSVHSRDIKAEFFQRNYTIYVPPHIISLSATISYSHNFVMQSYLTYLGIWTKGFHFLFAK